MEMTWNPFVTGIVDSFTDDQNLYLMMEVIPSGTLRSLIQTRGPFDAGDTAFYFANIVAGIAFLQDMALLHRDLKPDNILVGADGYLVITDFGTTARVGDDTAWAMIGSPAYMAPEVVCNMEGQTLMTFHAMDWWSAGVILYEMANRKLVRIWSTILSSHN